MEWVNFNAVFYSYIKALHIIFVVTWFAGMFYMPRLFIYNTEANDKEENEKRILQAQFSIMMKRLWYGITIPSGIITVVLGPLLMYLFRWDKLLLEDAGRWLLIKLFFVLLLYAYFYSLHIVFKQQQKGLFRFTSQQLRIWNEMATLFLFAIVFLAVVKTGLSFVTALCGLLVLMILLFIGIRLYKSIRKN